MITTSRENPEELKTAIERFIEGESEPGDDQLIAEAMQGDASLVEALREQLLMDGLLRQEAEPTAEVFWESVAARLKPTLSDYAFVARIEQALPHAQKPRKCLWRAPLAWVACLMLTLLFGALMFVSLTPASEESIVREALKTHSSHMDHCYRVEVRTGRDGDATTRQEALLWTRGDAFWTQIRSVGQTATWGRDATGVLWFTISPKLGARLTDAEVPEELKTDCELRSVRMETLLREFLTDYELRGEHNSLETEIIHAEPKVGATHVRYSSALLEIDVQSHLLRRLILYRGHAGHPVPVVSFSFIESTLKSETSYSLEGHLDPDGMVLDRNSPLGRRAQVIAEFVRLMRLMRVSGADVISRERFHQHPANPPVFANRPESADRLFDKLDTDANGALSKTEFAAFNNLRSQLDPGLGNDSPRMNRGGKTSAIETPAAPPLPPPPPPRPAADRQTKPSNQPPASSSIRAKSTSTTTSNTNNVDCRFADV
jgi:hypothetical protein